MTHLKTESGLLAALSATVLFGIALLTIVDGLEWALFSKLGAGPVSMEIVIGLTTIPLLYPIWLFGRAAVKMEWR